MTLSIRATLAVFGYNHAKYIDEAVRSALNQECEPIEIILSDDCSGDDTYQRMRDIAEGYAGPHRVIVRRNDKNLGMGGHFNAVMAMAAGQLVILMAADDISLRHRVARTLEVWDSSGGSLDLVASHVVDMTDSGSDRGVIPVDLLQRWTGLSEWTKRRPYVIGAAHSISRRSFERFGPLLADVVEEDQANTLRAVLAGGGWTIEEPLVRYRRGGLSTRVFEPAEYRAFEIRRNRRHLAGLTQWRSDAARAGCEGEVTRAVEWQLRREMFLKELLAASGLWRQLALLASCSDVSLGWRCKSFIKILAPRSVLAAQKSAGWFVAHSRCIHRARTRPPT